MSNARKDKPTVQAKRPTEGEVIRQLKELGLYKKFHCIYADPPWERNQRGAKLGAERHYNLMTQDELKAMPIKHLAADDAAIYIWFPPGLMDDVMEVAEAWGFKQKDLLAWPKPNCLALGHKFRHNMEPVFYGECGKVSVKCKNQPNLIFGPRQEHSHKPEEAFAIVERVSHPPYLELFARRQPTCSDRDNWAVWGNEVESDIYIPGYPVPEYSRRAKLPLELNSPDKAAEVG